MDLSAIGSRIKVARERKHLTQEDLAAIVDLSPTHISVIERGVKPPKLVTLVAIANALDVSADTLLQDVVDRSVEGVSNELATEIMKLPAKERGRIINAIRALYRYFNNDIAETILQFVSAMFIHILFQNLLFRSPDYGYYSSDQSTPLDFQP